MVTFDICKGNPGALSFLADAYSINLGKAEKAFQKMSDADICGDKLYMLWNDCCNRDTDKAMNIMLTHSIEDIVEHINYEHGRGIPYQNE